MRVFIHTISRVLWYATGIIEVLLAFRLASLLLGASVNALVVSLLYRATDVILIPFAGIFKNVMIGDGSILDLVTLTAMFGYPIGILLVTELLGLFTRHLPPSGPNV